MIGLRAGTVAEHNLGARRALERCGFHLEGRERQAIVCGGRRLDRLLYGLLTHELDPA